MITPDSFYPSSSLLIHPAPGCIPPRGIRKDPSFSMGCSFPLQWVTALSVSRNGKFRIIVCFQFSRLIVQILKNPNTWITGVHYLFLTWLNRKFIPYVCKSKSLNIPKYDDNSWIFNIFPMNIRNEVQGKFNNVGKSHFFNSILSFFLLIRYPYTFVNPKFSSLDITPWKKIIKIFPIIESWCPPRFWWIFSVVVFRS